MAIQGRILLKLSLLATCGISVGCWSVHSTEGDKSLPTDLRSSSDFAPPAVGAPDVAATQPGMWGSFGSLGEWVVMRAGGGGFEQDLADASSEDGQLRRAALLRLAERSGGKTEPFLAIYRKAGQLDPDPLVRAAGVRALNISRDVLAGPVFSAALGDGDGLVKLEAAKGLGNIPYAPAAAKLLAIVADESASLDLRIASADALRHYKSLEAGRALINQLNNKSFALAWQSRRSLFLMTGKDFRYNEGAWLEFITGPGKPLG
jgi:hypothetical protein